MVEKVGPEAAAAPERVAGPANALTTEPDWDAVCVDYKAEDMTVNAICRKYGIGRTTLTRRAARNKWVKGGRAKSTDRGILISQMMGLIEIQITHLEQTMTTTGETEVALLGKLSANLEKLIDIDERPPTGTPAAAKRAPRQTRDMREMRDKLAKRIEQLRQG